MMITMMKQISMIMTTMIQTNRMTTINIISIPKPRTTILTSGKKEWGGGQPNDVLSVHIDQQEEEVINDDVHSSNEDKASVEASVHDSIQADCP